MPVPPLTSAGLLPVGVHDATLDEIGEAFGKANDARAALFASLTVFCGELAAFGSLIKGVYVDGSFVTSKPVPGDIDLVVVHDEDDFPAIDDHPQAEYLFEDRAEERYGFDLFVDFDTTTMVQFFQRVSTEFALEHGLAAGHRKGIIRVVP